MASFLKRAALCAACIVFSITSPAFAQLQAGPGMWSAEQTWATDTTHGGALTGFYYWPATAPPSGDKRALVLVLHGCAQTARGDVIDDTSDGGFNWKAAADRYGAVILAPNATGNLYGFHCWDWAEANRSRNHGHTAVLLDLVSRFVTDPRYAIDPKQVYVTGLSSGAGKTMVLGCVAPDIFAGIGINSGPAPTVSTQQIGAVPPGTSPAGVAGSCTNWAGRNASHFSTQIAGLVWGTSDPLVSPAYGPLNAEAMRLVYGGSFTRGPTVSVPTGGSSVSYTDSKGKVRTSQMAVRGMLHAWAAGPGGQNLNFVDATKVNYPAFVMDFWFRNNLRVNGGPAMSSCSASVSRSTITVDGAATDAAGAIGSYRVVLNGPTPVDDAAAGSGASFSKTYKARADGYYSGTVTATGGTSGLVSNACTIPQFLVGAAPPLQPPAGLAAGAPTANSITLSWTASNGASGYNIYRNGAKVNGTPVTSTEYTDGGLAASTTYTYQVSATRNGGESARSAAVKGTTTAAFACTATTASNFAHVQAGRARNSGGFALANGSNQNMGLNNTFVTTTLAQTSAGHYVIGNCP